jgi:hypothetical protein
MLSIELNACSVPGQVISRLGSNEQMALTPITPMAARVQWDRLAGRPSRIEWGGRQLAISDLRALRDERQAHPADRGPRLTLVVGGSGGEAVLVYDARRARWFVEAVDLAA